MSFSIVYRNERDVEIPLLLDFIGKHRPKSLLDVGCSDSLYASHVRERMKNKRYDGVDPKYDPTIATFLDTYHVGSVMTLDLPKYDMVTCVSVIEHVGAQPMRAVNWREQRAAFFARLLALAERYLFVTFPFGREGQLLGQYMNVTAEELAGWGQHKARFFFNDWAQGGKEEWVEIDAAVAQDTALQHDRGCRCVAVLAVVK